MSNHPQKSGSLCSGMSGSLCSGIGGSLYSGMSGSLYSGIGGSLYPGIGGSLYPGIGGSLYPGILSLISFYLFFPKIYLCYPNTMNSLIIFPAILIGQHY
jgi:hypothetical protein